MAGIGRSTVYRRLEDPTFRARVSRERSDLVGRAVGQLADAGADFAGVLRSVALDVEAPHSARVAAARAGLELCVRLRESGELAERIELLEQALTQEGAAR
jgi:hypothetical protein